MGDAGAGKKVFFLYPPSVIKDTLVARLIEQEFEVYSLKDQGTASRLLRTWPESIIYINIDAGLDEQEWENWIRKTMADPLTSTVGIGIVSYNTDENLQRKYLMDIGIQCGFIKLKLGVDESTKILLATLKATEAKGRRKYVRATCANDTLTSVNIKHDNERIVGKINDISVVGFSCTFSPDPKIAKNSIVHGIQLKLRGSLLLVEAMVFGTRNDEGSSTYVLLFAPPLDQNARVKIRTYIQTALQADIDLQSIAPPPEPAAAADPAVPAEE